MGKGEAVVVIKQSGKQEKAQRNAGAGTGANFFCAGLILFIIFEVNGGLSVPCDKPLPFWLYIFWIVAFASCGAGCLVQVFIRSTGKKGPDGKATPGPLGKLCLCLLCLPSCFLTYWFIQGIIFLYNTEASDAVSNATLFNASSIINPMFEGNIALGLGCDPDLWRAVNGYVIFNFVVLGVALLCCCCTVLTTVCALRG